jgi:hypothetical protein
MLEWARYGPSSLDTQTHLRSLFFILFSLLSVDGNRAKAAYVLRAMRRPWGLASSGWKTLKGLIASRRKHAVTVTDLVFWIDPGTYTETEGH